MDELKKPANFNKLKAFFSELISVGFNLQRVPESFTVNKLPIKKGEALKLLRLLPEFAGEEFKDENFLGKFLYENQAKLAGLLDGLSAGQQAELRDLLLKPDISAAQEAGQPAIETDAEGSSTQSPLPVSEGITGNSSVGMPNAPSAPAMPRIIHNVPHAPETAKVDSVMEDKRRAVQPKTGEGKALPSDRRFNLPFLRSSTGSAFNKFQDFAAPANPFLKTNLNRIGEGFKSMFGNLGGAGLNALGRGLNLGGNAAGRLSNFKSSMGGRIKGVGNRASSAIKGGGKKFALASVFSFLLFFLIAMSGNMTGATPIGNAAPPAPVPPGPITPPIPPVPCTGNDYKACLLANYKLDFQTGWPDSFLQMAYQTLSSADSIAPKFKNLLIKSCSTIKVVPTTTGVNYISGCTANLKSTIGSLTLIHELSHIIHNSNPAYYEGLIVQARTLDAGDWEGGYLTWYSKYASRPTDFSTICYKDSTGEDYLKDEEFAESVSYFIVNAVEMNMGSGCQAKWSDNPYQNGNRYKGHYNLMSGILK